MSCIEENFKRGNWNVGEGSQRIADTHVCFRGWGLQTIPPFFGLTELFDDCSEKEVRSVVVCPSDVRERKFNSWRPEFVSSGMRRADFCRSRLLSFAH